MNREVLFRGKSVEDSEWVEGYLVEKTDSDSGSIVQSYIVEKAQFSWNADEDVRFCDIDEIKVLPETVGQFTGLTDKNGAKIFEDDILKARHNDYPYLVSYDECRFKIEDKWGNRIKMTQDAINLLEVELVGNIYDNPELLTYKT